MGTPASRFQPAISTAWSLLLDLVYPPRCGGCDRRGTLFCDECARSILPPADREPPDGIVQLVCAGAFEGPLREAIHKLKYEGDTPLAKPLAQLLFTALSRGKVAPGSVLIVPVPLHTERQRARGFNQSELLARELSRLTGWRVEKALRRTRNTRSQVGLGAGERQQNVAQAFEWVDSEVPKQVLLLDDVCTTGATLSECASALKTAGVVVVRAATIARAHDTNN